MQQNNNITEQRIRFVAKHYKPNTFDSKKGWEKLQQHIAPESKVRKFPVFYGAAAAVALLLVVSILYFTADKGETFVAKADNTAFILPDSSHITMQKGAELQYDKDFGETNRNVSMNGNISFDVERNESLPFIITTPTAQIQVLGTKFTIDENEGGTNLDVISGKVRFTANDPLIPLICTAGTKVRYLAENKEITITSADSRTVINGTENSLTFNNAMLQQVASILSHYYKTTIEVPENEMQIQLTSSFKGNTIQEIIDIINFTLDTHLSIDAHHPKSEN